MLMDRWNAVKCVFYDTHISFYPSLCIYDKTSTTGSSSICRVRAEIPFFFPLAA